MKPAPLSDDVLGLTVQTRVAYLAASLLCLEANDDRCAVTDVLAATGMTIGQWDLALTEMGEAMVAWPVCDDVGEMTMVSVGRVHDLLCFAIGAPGRPSAKAWAALTSEVFERVGRYCVYCGTRDGVMSVDHVVPIAKGGSNHRENLLPACKPCNSAKRDMDYAEFWQKRAVQ